MTAIPLFQSSESSLPISVYYAVGVWLVWAIVVATVAWQLWSLRKQSQAQLIKAQAPTEAPGQPDQPATEDSLGLGVAPVIVGLLTHPLTNEPYTIALSGGWGTGKSSVMLQIEQQLSAKLPFKAIRINVWHFQQENQLLTGFLRQILDQCNTFRFRRRQVLRNLRTLGFGRTVYRAGLLSLALPVLLLAIATLMRGCMEYIDSSGLFRGRLGELLASVEENGVVHWLAERLRELLRAPFYVIRHLPDAVPVNSEVTGNNKAWPLLLPRLPVVLGFVTLAGSVLASLRKLPELLRPLIELIPYQQQYEVVQDEATFRQRYQQDFGRIIRDAAGETLVIFVDDIDRISGPRVLELLETLNFIITSALARRGDGPAGAKLYFVLAMNVPEVVRVLGPVLDSHGQLTADEQRHLAASYLSKLVDLTMNIPSLQGRDINPLFQLTPAPIATG